VPDPSGWDVVRRRESPGAFHARPLPGPAARAVWVCDPDRPALVLGSAQRDDLVDPAACQRAGVEVVRRHSGGGAVLVVPGDLLWVDVVLPAGDPLWVADVGRAFLWLGEAWQRALASLDVGALVHRGPMVRSTSSDLVCFAGLGPGELTVAGPGHGAPAKVVGISQRRTRHAVRFQSAALLRWAPARLVELLALDGPDRGALLDDVSPRAQGLGVAPTPLLDAFLAQLP